jgi:hypothetical protein
MKRTLFLSGSLAVLLLLTACGTSNTSADLNTLHDETESITDDPSGVVTDDPNHEHHEDSLLGFDGAGISSVEEYLGQQEPAKGASRRSRNISLVGAGKGDSGEFNKGVFADVMGYKNLAFIGKWRGDCPGTGVDIFDISKPSVPVKISDTRDYADTSMEDMQAIKIGNRDILAIGLQDCGNSPAQGTVGLELYDITNPKQPQFLSLFNGADFGRSASLGHVHELDVTTTPSGRVLALASSPNLEANTATAATNYTNGVGDTLIIDISDPANPVLLADWGVLAEPELGVNFFLGAQQGSDARTQLHSVRANKDGTRAYLSYWDAGFIVLDISDPANPVYRGRTAYKAGDEGNAHSVDEARDGNLLIAADEDFSPFEFQFTSSAFAGARTAVEATFTPAIVDLPGRAMEGEVVHVGQGCPAGSINGTNPDDPYLADPAGKIALIERGGCRFDHKIARAQQAGATGVIVYNSAAGGEALVSMGGNNPTIMPDGSLVTVTIPAVFVQRSTGLLLRDGIAPVTARAAAVFNGWGYLRFYDISNPAAPKQLSTFATPNTNSEAVATNGTWSVHNPEVVGNTVYASWYSDGVRVIDISQPKSPREIGFWTGAGAPTDAPAVNIWSVVPHNGLLLASDRNYGLYVLKATP